MRPIDADALYERICDLEAQALSYVGKIGNDEAMRDKWRIWSAILAERTAFKHDVFDAPTIELKHEWIPIKWHDCTDADREKYGFSDDIVAVFDCEMPDDDQPILVTTSHGYVNQDVCYIDDGYSLDSGWDWTDDITAWMPLPEPYGGEQE